MKDKLKLTKTKLTFLILLLVIIALGTTYAILTWASSNTSIAGNTKCFKVDYTKGQDINFGSITSGTGLVAQTSFNKDEAVSTTLTISRNKDCDICGTGSISANITASIDLSKGGLSYKVYLGSSEVKSGSITKTGVNTLYDNFDIKNTTSTTYTIYFYLDSNKINNDYLQTNFTGKIYAEAKSTNEICKNNIPTFVNNITDKYNNGTKNQVTTAGGEAITQVVSEGLMQDSFGNIRYYGANPNNYVTFNGESAGWRIIGIFDTEDENGNVSKRIKLIRATSIGNYSWDNKNTSTGAEDELGKNDWTTARLMKLLNPSTVYTTDSNDNGNGQSLYWNKTSGTCFSGQNNATTSCDFTSTGLTSQAQSQIDKVMYYLGGTSSYQGLYADDYYNFERGTTVYSGRQTPWNGYIGIMYPSDYVYATDLSVCTKDGYNYNEDTTNCTGTDWLFNSSNTWLISPFSIASFYAFGVLSSGGVVANYAFDYYGVRPVAYLKSSTQIVNGTGTGTQSDPYIIG